jgi:hypothetical protein
VETAVGNEAALAVREELWKTAAGNGCLLTETKTHHTAGERTAPVLWVRPILAVHSTIGIPLFSPIEACQPTRILVERGVVFCLVS